MAPPAVRKGMPTTTLDKATFSARLRARFFDPEFDKIRPEIDRIVETAWEIYQQSRKSPHTRAAGDGFADPSYELSVEWLDARQRIQEAERLQKDPASPSRILIINGSSRSDQTVPVRYRRASAWRRWRATSCRGSPASLSISWI